MASGSIANSIYGSFGRRRHRRRRSNNDPGRFVGTPRNPVHIGGKIPGTDYGTSWVPDSLVQRAQTPGGFDPPKTSPTPGGAGAPGQQPAFNPAYDTGMAAIRERYGNLAGQYQYGNQALSQEFGLNAQGREITDPHDALYNPFNRMAMLRQSFQTANRAQTGQLANRGQLYSGALQQRLDLNRQGYNQGEDELQRSFANSRQALLDAWLSGQYDLGLDRADLEGENRDFQLDRENAIPAVGTGGGGGATGGTQKPSTQKPTATKPSTSLTPQKPGTRSAINTVGSYWQKPTRRPRQGYKWVYRRGRWRQVRKRN